MRLGFRLVSGYDIASNFGCAILTGQYKEKGYSLLGFLEVFDVLVLFTNLVLVGFFVVITWLPNYPKNSAHFTCMQLYKWRKHDTLYIYYSSYNAATVIANVYTVFTTTVSSVHQSSFIPYTLTVTIVKQNAYSVLSTMLSVVSFIKHTLIVRTVYTYIATWEDIVGHVPYWRASSVLHSGTRASARASAVPWPCAQPLPLNPSCSLYTLFPWAHG